MKRIISLTTLFFVTALFATSFVSATGAAEPAVESQAASSVRTIDSLIADGVAIPDVGTYAEGFEAVQNGSLTVVSVTRPWQNARADDALHYVLYPRELERPLIEDADLLVPVPVDSMVTMSTTFLGHLKALARLDTLVAVDSVAFAYAPEVHRLFEAEELIEVGSGPGVDVEQLITLNADLIMVNSYGGDWDAQPTLDAADLPVVVNGDWVESTPLGRAEWLLFTALFYDELDAALELFTDVEREYARLASLAALVTERPRVLINAPYQGTWSVSGGDSYAAQFIEDAGGDYVWSDDSSTGALFLDLEAVYAEAGDADVWINPGGWNSLRTGAAEDERFTSFRAFETGMVFNNNRRLGPGGGNDYFESGAVNPHIILNDLVWIFHREMVPEYEPFYYQQLK